ncbi:uncharacterized protein [Littorina saxatilis]|uniref:Uncharacterized protein n=1 Tax=Littorina saxatilis TaxID=31220 RepID=A0AAN9B6J7_9CAEN
MTARSKFAANPPSTSVVEPVAAESSDTCPLNRPLPIMQNCCIKSTPPLPVAGPEFTNLSAIDPSPSTPMQGESPNDILLKMYDAWSEQLADSYRPNVQVNPQATAENNRKRLQELYPPNKWGAGGGLTKARAAGVVVETVCHFGKKMLYKHVARSGEVFASTVRG